jgi:hypothetical protein
MPERVIKAAADVSPIDVFGGKATREHRIRVRSQRSERLQFPTFDQLERSSVTAKRHLPYMNLTEIIFAFPRILQKMTEMPEPPILLRNWGDIRMRSERAGRAYQFLALLAAT